MMKIAVVGLGLIGGSLCKSIKKYTDRVCLGMDIDPETAAVALSDGNIDRVISTEELSEADMTIVCLYPDATVKFIRENIDRFKKDSIIIDICGVKAEVVDGVKPIAAGKPVTYVSTHPMAGREFSGYAYSEADLFKDASFIMVPLPGADPAKLAAVEELARKLQFGRIVRTTPEEHDRIIAFTSQLAHVVSNAYVKSPTLSNKTGFSAGSFLDLTRVAKLNENMWASLFIHNRLALLDELKIIISHLLEYEKALESGDEDSLRDLLRDGRALKEKSLLE